MSTCPTAHSDSARSPAPSCHPLTTPTTLLKASLPASTEESALSMRERKVVIRNTFIAVEPNPEEKRKQTGVQRLQTEPALPVSFRMGEDGIKEVITADQSEVKGGAHEQDSPCVHGSGYLADLRSMGSLRHRQGCCPEKRCYWYFTRHGCSRGWMCKHCHYCKPVEKEKRSRKPRGGVKERTKPEEPAAAASVRPSDGPPREKVWVPVQSSHQHSTARPSRFSTVSRSNTTPFSNSGRNHEGLRQGWTSSFLHPQHLNYQQNPYYTFREGSHRNHRK
uniref:C3H1-type domain-containing protein n=1 Tax=Chromera velia CCMP2878 TaxID=1169474 RepID=A0A0G4HMX0_9ALVE|eukprot:Cvel_29360.t1-p1 / transcript=Cvel_29360.t1 / gene=Cvel_29360 / organism=Chromera_velia_CCMP2878 / gene_product=hypothetical protein / transcript_product=hypothetical protein / location=Cvel_scaffold3998:6357-7476(+) / protein_length=277 / sequence_SO=supercontig / SO=protein_coding / is_pseudo=false